MIKNRKKYKKKSQKDLRIKKMFLPLQSRSQVEWDFLAPCAQQASSLKRLKEVQAKSTENKNESVDFFR